MKLLQKSAVERRYNLLGCLAHDSSLTVMTMNRSESISIYLNEVCSANVGKKAGEGNQARGDRRQKRAKNVGAQIGYLHDVLSNFMLCEG